jgi:hypothetical protein
MLFLSGVSMDNQGFTNIMTFINSNNSGSLDLNDFVNMMSTAFVHYFNLNDQIRVTTQKDINAKIIIFIYINLINFYKEISLIIIFESYKYLMQIKFIIINSVLWTFNHSMKSNEIFLIDVDRSGEINA